MSNEKTFTDGTTTGNKPTTNRNNLPYLIKKRTETLQGQARNFQPGVREQRSIVDIHRIQGSKHKFYGKRPRWAKARNGLMC
jgi:hypothetical protein